MAIIVVLAVFTLIFWLIRRQAGTAFLATIAGVTIYTNFGADFVNFLKKIFEQAPVDLLQSLVYLALVLVMPMVLYFHSREGGLFGLLRIAESVIFAALMTSLVAEYVALFFTFDELSIELVKLIAGIKGWVIMAGSLTAYLEILLTRE